MWHIELNGIALTPHFVHRSVAVAFVRNLIPAAFFPHDRFDHQDLSLALVDQVNSGPAWTPLTIRIQRVHVAP